jgi:hypothetical protein
MLPKSHLFTIGTNGPSGVKKDSKKGPKDKQDFMTYTKSLVIFIFFSFNVIF